MEEKPILELKNISKHFPGVNALTDVSIEFFRGEAHALVGENGAGKSTLIKIISGVYQPSVGEIYYEGEKREFKTPGEALDVGISVIHQELSVAKDLTVAENIFLGTEPKKGMMLDRKKMEKDATMVLDSMGVSIKANDLTGRLSAAHQQMVEIAKVIVKKSKFVIMDEPTSSLSESEIDSLFKQIDILKKNNVAIIYITHRMKELPIIANRVTVLRDGVKISTNKTDNVTEHEIVTSMVGREISDYYNKKEHHAKEEMLRVEGLAAEGVFSDVSFTAYKGEILGISGLVGAGRTEVLQSIFGERRLSEGKVFIKGQEVKFSSPLDAIAGKMGFVTEDRRTTGLMLQASIKHNIGLPSIKRTAKSGLFIDNRWEDEATDEYIGKLGIKAPSGNVMVNKLSGGNQQKVVLAKWLVAQSEILLLDEPTRGIDVNAKSEFYALMNDFVARGGCIVMVSSEMPEVLGVADRILVMREGRISGELTSAEASEERIIRLASLGSEAI